MILATKIALPTVDVVTDALNINKVLSLSNAKWEQYETYSHLIYWRDPRLDWNTQRRKFTLADWNNFTDNERSEFMDRYSYSNYMGYTRVSKNYIYSNELLENSDFRNLLKQNSRGAHSIKILLLDTCVYKPVPCGLCHGLYHGPVLAHDIPSLLAN